MTNGRLIVPLRYFHRPEKPRLKPLEKFNVIRLTYQNYLTEAENAASGRTTEQLLAITHSRISLFAGHAVSDLLVTCTVSAFSSYLSSLVMNKIVSPYLYKKGPILR